MHVVQSIAVCCGHMEVEALGMEWEEIQLFKQFSFVLKAMAFSYIKSYIVLSSSKVQTPFISVFSPSTKFLTTAQESGLDG